MTGNPDAVGLAFSCRCGGIKGALLPTGSRYGTLIRCHCRDCRAGELFHSQPDPAPDGVSLVQTTPDRLRFERGRDKLALMRLSPKGMLRWYAGCCATPMFATLSRPGLPFVDVMANVVTNGDALGRVKATVFLPAPGGQHRHKGAMNMALQIFLRMGAARLSGRWRDTPFFDPDTGKPIAKAIIPDANTRKRIYP